MFNRVKVTKPLPQIVIPDPGPEWVKAIDELCERIAVRVCTIVKESQYASTGVK